MVRNKLTINVSARDFICLLRSRGATGRGSGDREEGSLRLFFPELVLCDHWLAAGLWVTSLGSGNFSAS